MLFLLVFVHRQEFLLLGVKETDDVTSFKDVVEIFSMFHKQRNLPGCCGIHDVDFLAAGIVWQFVIGCYVKNLATAVDGIKNNFVAQHDRVASRA